MKTNIFLVAIGALLVTLCSSAEAQRPKKVPRIGYLSGTDRATDAPRADGIRRALRDFGYVEGQNIVIEYRHAGEKRSRASLRTSWFISKLI
jgi:putative ABC transport system substrate-binding protein